MDSIRLSIRETFAFLCRFTVFRNPNANDEPERAKINCQEYGNGKKGRENSTNKSFSAHTAQTTAYQTFFRPVNKNKISHREWGRGGEGEMAFEIENTKEKQKHPPRTEKRVEGERNGSLSFVDLSYGTTAGTGNNKLNWKITFKCQDY